MTNLDAQSLGSKCVDGGSFSLCQTDRNIVILSILEARLLNAFLECRHNVSRLPRRRYAEDKVHPPFPLLRIGSIEKSILDMSIKLLEKIGEPPLDILM